MYTSLSLTQDIENPDDPHLEWLETTSPLYLEGRKNIVNTPRQFLSKETYEALLMTTYSTVTYTATC